MEKEQLIGFTVAVLAKEKRFNEITSDLYILDSELRSAKANNNGRTNSNYIERENYIVYAKPTQSLLQKWLREVHKIQTEVTYYRDANCYFVKLCNFKDSDLFTSTFYNTYEKALEKGLLEALKLIKNT
jgi:hypothetical protein